MPQTDVIVYKYSEDLVNIPRAHLALELKQDIIVLNYYIMRIY